MKKTITLKITFDADITSKTGASYSEKIMDVIYENIPSVIKYMDGDYIITVNTAQIEEIK